MFRRSTIISIHLFIAVFAIIPVFVFGQDGSGLVPCEGADCNFDALIILVQNVIDFLLKLSAPVAAIMFAYAGWLYILGGTSGSDEKIKQASGIFKVVVIGLVIMLSAWLIVWTISNALLDPNFIRLEE